MGIFFLSLFAIIAGVGLYWILRSFEKKIKLAEKGRRYLGNQLFFSGFLRFMIVSNFELTVTVWGFFIFSYN